ncbi:hypothetical protein [uncultured Croceitalea sp.]|uniref:hypothetical protein n=1 Tax=uncultured Croceitalea sp. TaxID=1798908 RepID=UPI003305BF32
MTKNKGKGAKMGMVIGIIGFLAGIFLVIQENYLIGISGGIASAGLAWINYNATKQN